MDHNLAIKKGEIMTSVGKWRDWREAIVLNERSQAQTDRVCRTWT